MYQCVYCYFCSILVFLRYTGILTVCRFPGIKFLFNIDTGMTEIRTFFSILYQYIAKLYSRVLNTHSRILSQCDIRMYLRAVLYLIGLNEYNI